MNRAELAPVVASKASNGGGGRRRPPTAVGLLNEPEGESGYERNEGLTAPPRVWLTVPLPDYRLSPNGTRNKYERHRLASQARTNAYITAISLFPGERMPFFGAHGRAVLDVVVSLPKGKRRLDDDGLIGLLKSTVDALQGPIVGNDRYISWGVIRWTRTTAPGGSVKLILTAP
jgi:hypothetical protein